MRVVKGPTSRLCTEQIFHLPLRGSASFNKRQQVIGQWGVKVSAIQPLPSNKPSLHSYFFGVVVDGFSTGECMGAVSISIRVSFWKTTFFPCLRKLSYEESAAA